MFCTEDVKQSLGTILVTERISIQRIRDLYTERAIPEMVEFDSMINIRPRQNNRSRGVEDPQLQERILTIVRTLVQ